MATAPATPAYRRFVLAMLFIVFTLNYLDRQIIAILGPAIKQDLHLSDTQLGLMGGFAFAIFYTVLGIPAGLLADRRKRTGVIAGAITIWSGATALCGAAVGFWSLFLSRMLVGVGESGGVTPCYSIIADYYPASERGRALAVFAFGIPFGSALGLFIGGVVAATFGWRATFVIVGLVGIFFAPLFYKSVREPVRGAMDPPRAAAAATEPKVSLRGTLAIVRGKRSFWLMAFSAGIMSMLGFGMAFWLPSFFVRERGLTLIETAQVMSVLTLAAGVIGMSAGGLLSDRFGSRDRRHYGNLPAIVALLALPSMLVAMTSDSLTVTIAALLIPMIAQQFWVPGILAAMTSVLPARARTSGSAVYALVVNLIGLGCGTAAMGVLSDHFVASNTAEPLRHAMIYAAIVILPIAAVLFHVAGRFIERDWESAPIAPADGQ
ncbi:spinster family MFS transporter [Sphingomonas sp.]|uniref:spinster family MFS transporter n=1 Tax=Sphingomonas sp. TaxID=28214 RepID=UPI002DD638E6|nr:MFS transporter [Sphingomonas sp.]